MSQEALSPQSIESISEGLNLDTVDEGQQAAEESEKTRFLRSSEACEVIKKIRNVCGQLSPLRCAISPPRFALRIDYGWLDATQRPCDSGFIRVNVFVRVCEDGGSVLTTQTSQKPPKPKKTTKRSPGRQAKAAIELPQDPWRRKLLLKISLKLWLSTLEWACLDSCRLSIQGLNDHLGVNVPRDVCDGLFKKLLSRKAIYVEDGARYVDTDIINEEEDKATAQLESLQVELEKGAPSLGSSISNT